MENYPENDEDFIEQNLPIKYLLDEHVDDVKRDRQNEGVELFCGRAKHSSIVKPVIYSVTMSFVLQRVKFEAYDDRVLS